MTGPITFDDLPGTPDVDASAQFRGRLRLQGFATESTQAELGGIFRGNLRLQQGRGGDEAVITPPASFAANLHLRQGAFYSPGSYPFAAFSGSLRLRGLFESSSAAAIGRLRLRGKAQLYTADDVVTPPDYWVDTITLYDSFVIAEKVTAIDGLLLRSAVRLKGTAKTKAVTVSVLNDALTLEDRFNFIMQLMLKDAIVLDESVTFDYTAVMRLHDSMILSGVVSTHAEAVMLMAESVAFSMAMEAVLFLGLTDSVQLSDIAYDSFTTAMQLVDHLLVADAATATGTIALTMHDTVRLSDEALTTSDVVAMLTDAVGVTMRFTLDDGKYVAWTMNADNKASSKYEQWPFNSYMKIGSRYYGVCDTGVYRLEGDTDDTAAINARVRLGMSALGSRMAKHVPDVYLGYSASGDLLLKAVIADSTTGQRESHVYRLHANDSAGSVREARTKLGRGLSAVYWDFELVNDAGADFDIDAIEFMPLQTQRRLRGNAGGKK